MIPISIILKIAHALTKKSAAMVILSQLTQKIVNAMWKLIKLAVQVTHLQQTLGSANATQLKSAAQNKTISQTQIFVNVPDISTVVTAAQMMFTITTLIARATQKNSAAQVIVLIQTLNSVNAAHKNSAAQVTTLIPTQTFVHANHQNSVVQVIYTLGTKNADASHLLTAVMVMTGAGTATALVMPTNSAVMGMNTQIT